uniref:Uncharacterized membrane protein ycf78 n=1 Tax=Stigeoclonium helveticum TaxID=55999 RepID=YCF78_STIHE|nr:hypothetical chloroplast RF1 [Stigeoclonium helveticum]Q06SH2.1 RecName: Full=Uncharacterized membrane protein ycf78; AltName: Full=RF1; AltName: Full=ycf1 [Stigeoclonium helveticum]ABF60203.1 hypothetical chloroplast RF1 [Stigeoclonium helveticum]
MTVLYLVKDYIEVVHKLIETSPSHVLQHSTYNDSLTIINFGLSTLKQLCSNFFSFEWLKQLWYFPIIVPEIATSMMEEISVLDGNFHNILSFLDKPVAVGNEIYGDYYLPLTCFEKIFTGLVNSLFIWIPTSTATFLCFRRFIMQGVEAGYAAALGTMAATVFWLASILFGLRFIVVPWMSLDLFRYWLGFLLLMKYFWDNRYAYKEVKHNSVFGKKTKRNIFGFHFLLALTEQTSLYPFLSNFSISSQSTLLEGFPSENILDFSLIHFSYLLGIGIGSYSLINLICWFWQDPAYRFYFWMMNKFKKLRIADIVRPVHLFFQSITVLFAFSSLPYFGIEYQITNPLGFLPNDQAFHQFKQTSFLTHPTSPAYYRSRLNFPRQKFFRYEDWAEYYHRNTPLDTSLYDQGAYRLYTMEDLSYGKDYEWMRRRSDKIKIRSRLKRLRWFPRNWANRLWEFTKTWSRRNVLWRNDILNMYQYSWDSKAPIIWNKLVFEEFFPTTFGQQKSFSRKETELKKHLGSEVLFSSTKKPISTNWDSFWGPDPDWTSKFLWNQNSLNNKEKQLWFNWQSRLNLTDNDTWWKWLVTNGSKSKAETLSFQNIIPQFSNKIQKGDFWEPQKRLISIYSENSQKKELVLESSTLRKFVRKLSARFKLAQIDKVSQLNNAEKKEVKTSFFLQPLNNGIWYNSNTLSSNSLKTLLLTPSFRDWTVFQTVMTNMNRILWWRRLTNASKSKSTDLSGKLSYQFDPKMKLKTLNQRLDGKKEEAKASSFLQLSTFSKPNNFLSNSALNNFKRFVKTQKLSYSENKFAKIQNKYLEIQMKQNLLINSNSSNKNNLSSLFSPSKTIEQFENKELKKETSSSLLPFAISPLSQSKNYKNMEINNLKVLNGKKSGAKWEKEKSLRRGKKLSFFPLLPISSLSPREKSSFSLEERENMGHFPPEAKLPGEPSFAFPTLFLTKKNNNKFILFKNKNKVNVNKWVPLNSVDVSSTLLHPLKYYLHKEQNFKRKLSFYGVKNKILSKSIKDSSSILNENGNERKAGALATNFSSQETKISSFPQNVSKTSSTDLFYSTYNTGSSLKSYPEATINQNQNWNSLSLKKNNYSEKLFPITKNKNKLPIFNFYLKTYFQTYKKTKLYVLNTKMKRQLGMGASARRKGRDYSNKLLKRSKILSNTPWIRQWIDQSGFLARRKRLETWIARQHYDPNELWSKIMKVDVDLFMNRQPSYYFLTNTEEKLLHLRRFLLFEHYDSLRWYTYMTNYRTMKNTIGGTKSFTNRMYNQQFKGTFHKVRHLFSLTPSSSNGSLLKFDRPLYNLEKTNQSSLTSQAHEELQNFTNFLKHDDNVLSEIDDFREKLLEKKAKAFFSNNDGEKSEAKASTVPQSFLNKSIGKMQENQSDASFFKASPTLEKNSIFSSETFLSSFEKRPMDLIEKSTQTLQQSIWENNLIRKNYISFLLEQKNYDLLTKFLVSNTLYTPESIKTKNYEKWEKDVSLRKEEDLTSSFSPSRLSLLKKNSTLRINKSIKTNLQTKLMISLFRKRQKWTRDYKRASEKLWKKWKLRSKLISNKTLYLLSNDKTNELNLPQLRTQLYSDQKQEKIVAPVTNPNYYGKNISTLDKKFLQIIKLKKLTEIIKSQDGKKEEAQEGSKPKLASFSHSSFLSLSSFNHNNTVVKEKAFSSMNNSTLSYLNRFNYNSVIGKALKEAIEIQYVSQGKTEKKQLNGKKETPDVSFDNIKILKRNIDLKNIFNNNIFTKKMIKDMYKNSFKHKKLSIAGAFQSKKSSTSLWTNSFLDYKLQNRLDNRFYNTSRNKLKSDEMNTKLLTQTNLQLYQKNLIRRERSNIQNFVFMKKFLLNDYNSPLTRSQIRPLPGKRTKALYEKSTASGSYSSNLIRKNNPFLSSINDIDLKILAYKNRKWVESVKTDNNLFQEKVDGKKKVAKATFFPSLSVSKLNNNWKLFLNKIKKSPKLVSGQMDQTLQTKMINEQNLMKGVRLSAQLSPILTNAITNNISKNALKKEIKTVFLMNEKSAGTVLEDSSVLKNFVRQKLTKTILSKQKIINSLEKPTIIRITKSLRKRQQDRIVRSLLKRHLNLKSRRKLFLKTKEINNQRMSLDRKYEIEERLFLNKISYFAELKQLLDLNNNSLSKDSIFKGKNEFVLANKNLLKINSFKNENNVANRDNLGSEEWEKERSLSFFPSKASFFNSSLDFPSKQQNFQLTESGKFTKSKNLVENFVIWLSLSNNKNLDSFSPLTEFSERQMKEKSQSSRLFSITNRRNEKNIVKNLKNKKVTVSIIKNFQNKGKQMGERKKFQLFPFKSFFSSPHFIDMFYLRKKEGIFFTKEKISGNVAESEKMRAGDKQSYLSSIKRSSLFINKLLTNNQNNRQNQNNESYLSFKLKQNFVNFSVLENEKNILRRSLRKFISPNSMPPFLFEKMRRGGEDQFYKSTRKYSEKFKPITNATKRKNSFVNNFLLKNWIRLKNLQKEKEESFSSPLSFSYNLNNNKNNKTDIKEKNNRLLSSFVFEKMGQKNSSKEELINLNKYIIFARTNQNKLSRQQMRKKLKKRRIIRLKRNDRLKTLRDHPLKFRSEQIQTFYNIRDSLKKWKNFSFISSKVKYNKAFWTGYNNRQLFSNTSGLNSKANTFSFPQTNIQVATFNDNLESQSRNYKPLLDNGKKSRAFPASEACGKLGKNCIFPLEKVNKLKLIDFSHRSVQPLKSKNYLQSLNLQKSEELNQKAGAKTQDFYSASLPFLENTLSPFYTNGYLSFSDSFENKNILNSDLFYTLYQDIFINSPAFNKIGLKSKSTDFFFQTNQLENSLNSKLLVNNTNMPFYAGWDDSVRKFVLTNRLLTRKEAGYEISNIFNKKNESQKFDIYSSVDKKLNNTNNVVFSSWPLKGKNAATTLFSQFPFMTAPETNVNNSDKQIRVVKAGTKYIIEGLTNSTKFNKDTSSFDNKWIQKNKNHLIKDKNNIKEIKGSIASDFSPNINFKKNKRIKTIIKSSKNEDQIGIRQTGQVISNLATATSRKTARRALFSSRPWRSKRQTTKAILFSLSQKDNQSSLNVRKNPKLFLSLNSKKEFMDTKLSSKLLLLRNLRHGNRSQTKLAYLRRLQNFIRPTGSAWKTTLNLSRRKKQRIKQSNFFSSRFSVRKRKKRGNNKNPRLRGDKNYKKTKRQYRQKLYLRPKNKPLRRRSLGVAFQNKLNYWRRQYQNLSTNQNSGLKDKVQLLNKQALNCASTNPNCFNVPSEIDDFRGKFLGKKALAFFPKNDGKILFSQNLKENLVYSQKDNEWTSSRRPRKLYRSLFKNPSRQNPILYSTLPGHSRSIPIIKNLPLPGSSVKTLNRIIKWSSADGAARFYRVNLSYGWAMELFLQNLHQKIKSKNNYLINGNKSEAEVSAFPLIKEYLNQLVNTNKNKFSSSRVFKRRFYKLRQLSYTMSLRLYDRWFFYYYKTGNSGEQSNGNSNFQEKTGREPIPISTFSRNRFNNQIKQVVLAVPSLSSMEPDLSQFKHIKKFLTFHLNENQSNFRSYLKNLRTTSYLKTQSITTEITPKLSNSGITDNSNKIENYDSPLLGDARTKDFDGLESFKLVSTGREEAEASSPFSRQKPGFEKSDLSKSGQFPEDKMNLVKSNKTLLKKEKKYAEDRFFFAQFNKPPLVDDSRLTFENNRHFPLNGGFVWPGDYLRLKTILLPKEMKDLYLLEKNKNFNGKKSGAKAI